MRFCVPHASVDAHRRFDKCPSGPAAGERGLVVPARPFEWTPRVDGIADHRLGPIGRQSQRQRRRNERYNDKSSDRAFTIIHAEPGTRKRNSKFVALGGDAEAGRCASARADAVESQSFWQAKRPGCAGFAERAVTARGCQRGESGLSVTASGACTWASSYRSTASRCIAAAISRLVACSAQVRASAAQTGVAPPLPRHNPRS